MLSFAAYTIVYRTEIQRDCCMLNRDLRRHTGGAFYQNREIKMKTVTIHGQSHKGSTCASSLKSILRMSLRSAHPLPLTALKN